MNTSRDAWLAERRKGVGGSDAAAALGQSRHKTILELFFDKTGQSIAPRAGLEDTERTDFGRAMEGVIATMYAKRFNVKLRRRNQIIRHPKYPFMLASVDRLIEGKREGFEAKNVDGMAFRFGEWGEEHSDEVPPEYLLQCHHYMTVLDYPVWHLAACIGGNRLMVYHIERDPEMSDMIIDGEMRFWTHVETGEPPPLDYMHPSAVGLLKRLYPGSNGEKVALNPDLLAWHRVRVDAGERIKQYEAVRDGASAHLLEAMGDAAVGLLPGGGEYRRKVVHRDAYTVDAVEYVDFRYAKGKGQANE